MLLGHRSSDVSAPDQLLGTFNTGDMVHHIIIMAPWSISAVLKPTNITYPPFSELIATAREHYL